MINNQPLHKAQALILDVLRHAEAARFSDLMQPTGLTSDAFKFHIRKLVHAGIIEKIEAGEYRLTIRGKEVAGTVARNTRTVQKQPKLSVSLVISRSREDGQTEYLVRQRRRNPFYHYWGFISGPIRWGEAPESAADRELKRQAGIVADFSVRGFYRERDYDEVNGELLEDKLLTVMVAAYAEMNEAIVESGTQNAWMTLRELQAQERFFASCIEMLHMVDEGRSYASRTVRWPPGSF